MTIKILGGLAAGRSLFVPKGNQTRPTSVMLRRKLFDSHQNLSDIHFVDLCAGTGAMGLEAWSRGAESVRFRESHNLSRKNLERNIQEIKKHFPEETQKRPLIFERGSATQWQAPSDAMGETIVFFDPPYEDHKLYKDVLKNLFSNSSLNSIWVESDRQKGLTLAQVEEYGIKARKVYEQGTSFIAVFSPDS